MFIDTLKQQHAAIISIVKRLNALLDEPQLDGERVRAVLIDLSGKVSVHLATEDKVLYPQLKSHSDGRIATLATRFANEMGDIGTVFKQYLNRYPTAQSITADAASFVRDTRGVIAVFDSRIRREETELYPLVKRRPS